MTFKPAFIALLVLALPAFAQTQRMSLRAMLALKKPTTDKIYHITDSDKEGDWRYDAQDTESEPNIGTILVSNKRDVIGRFKRIFDLEKGVNIDWFLTDTDNINDGLRQAMLVSEQISFGPKIYQIAPITIMPYQLMNPNRLILNFHNTTLQAQNDLNQAKVIQIENIVHLSLLGNVTLDGNASKLQIVSPLKQGGEAFLQIVAPKNNTKSVLEIGSLTIKNMPMCGVNVITQNDEQDLGYDRIKAKALKEINGYNQLNIQRDDFVAWGMNFRGAHRAVLIDTLYTQQDNEPWGDAPIEKSFYTFTFENQVDPTACKRKDSLYIKNLIAKNPCSLVLYTQAINHVLIDNYLIDGALRKPNVADSQAYPTMLSKQLSWVGSKHTWTSYKSPNSSFRIKRLLIKNTNPAFMNNAINDMTGLWLNKGITGAVFGEIDTDVRLKFYGDGYYSGLTDVPEGKHYVKKFVCRIPTKRNYVQPFNGDITIDSLYLTKNSGVTMRRSNARIKAIKQENGTKASFEQ
jgi:hypothetical protein